MRLLLTFLLFAATANAGVDYDQVTEWIENEQFSAAYEAMRSDPAPDRENERFWSLWRDAVRGVARDLQRARGYAPALDFLEQHLDTRPIVEDYVETCIWAGQEQRGLDTIRAFPPAFRDRCAYAEFQIYYVWQDYDAMEKRAREVKWDKWIQFAREQRELRERFESRTKRGWWVAIGGIAAILAACFGIDRLLRPKAA